MTQNTLQKDLSLTKVLIVGGTSGIGRGLVDYYAQTLESEIFIIGHNQERLDKVIAEVKEYYHKQGRDELSKYLHCRLVDLSDTTQSIECFTNLFKEYSDINYIIYTAGITTLFTPSKIKAINVQYFINLHIYSPIAMIQALLKYKDPSIKCSIVLTSSIASIASVPYNELYAIAKNMVNSFVKGVYSELIQFNTNINAIAPVYVDTPFIDTIKDNLGENSTLFTDYQPMGLIPIEQIVKDTINLLQSKYVTGQTHIINAGTLY